MTQSHSQLNTVLLGVGVRRRGPKYQRQWRVSHNSQNNMLFYALRIGLWPLNLADAVFLDERAQPLRTSHPLT